jgi:hypothetical protein
MILKREKLSSTIDFNRTVCKKYSSINAISVKYNIYKEKSGCTVAKVL